MIVATQAFEQPKIGRILVTVLLASLALVLPGIHFFLFGWSYLFLPLLGFFIFGKFGWYTGKKILLVALAISLLANLFLGSFDLYLFSCAMLAPGIVLQRSAMRSDSPALSGLKGSLTLIGGWLLVVAFASFGSEVSAYGQMLQTLDQALTETLEHYRKSSDFSADALIVVETTFRQMKQVLPGILGGVVLIVIWTTMMLGNFLMVKSANAVMWPSFRQWQLPERLIWTVVGMGACILIPIEPLPEIGINCILLLCIVYCFQGFSVTVFFMNKWQVPLFIRSFFYVMIVFQSLGTLILLLFGVADIWVDFRKLKTKAATGNE
jgi:uncharacterized protein YybS (DUF2232 family)